MSFLSRVKDLVVKHGPWTFRARAGFSVVVCCLIYLSLSEKDSRLDPREVDWADGDT